MTPFCGPGVSPGTELAVSLAGRDARPLDAPSVSCMDERGDPEAIAQLKAASRAYLATFLPHVEAPAGGGSDPVRIRVGPPWSGTV